MNQKRDEDSPDQPAEDFEHERDDGKKLDNAREIIDNIPHDLLVKALTDRAESESGGEPFPEIGAIGIARQFSGPLPPPEMLDQYNQIEPGAAHRILSMAENEQLHRHSREREALNGEIAKDKRGQSYALVVSMTIILGSIGLIAIGEQIWGTVLAGGTLVGLASTFVAGRRAGRGREDTGKEES